MAAIGENQMQSLSLEGNHEEEEDDIDFCDGDEIEEEIEEDINEDIDFVDDGGGQTSEDNLFDQIIGALEDLLISPAFEALQHSFAEEHCEVFEEGENKLTYTEIFEQYTNMLESAFHTHLTSEVEGFDMSHFGGMLNERKDTLDGEVFDMLLTMTEFESFKELMLSYKQETKVNMKELDLMLSTSGLHIYAEEQEDGDERPDLNMDLCITSLGK
mmetsp:Transcript_20629/g.28565  ORF Transcript_20629/g.28565 Transcript_20629/m.28565 type:complete len:215 (-) Transcript_20629:250-894(-)|eukprot:CAMPEP_0196586276 /NCGR_PEP_ID=MMETSP1081-20130531/53721_1 /TAXON_ID=36882 /ORGANISM="Pyramimonas amylifera, Strain CCMP720" /LENGTH=214 /DNA_ID=CAMNT_0041908101 /DNA_START=169 /DNA_END=813 /DNA_ORIENTATION=+